MHFPETQGSRSPSLVCALSAPLGNIYQKKKFWRTTGQLNNISITIFRCFHHTDLWRKQIMITHVPIKFQRFFIVWSNKSKSSFNFCAPSSLLGYIYDLWISAPYTLLTAMMLVAISISRCHHISIGISITKIRQCNDCLIIIMRIS